MIDTDWATTVPAARAGSSETVHVVGLVTPPESKEGVVHLVQETMGAKRNGDVHQRGVLFTVASGSDAANDDTNCRGSCAHGGCPRRVCSRRSRRPSSEGQDNPDGVRGIGPP